MAYYRAFWETKTLEEMSSSEWESLCDGCGKCCLHKLEDDETGDIYYTNVACQLLDTDKGCCTDYPNRLSRVPGCTVLTLKNLDEFDWLPLTCSYRLIRHRLPLPEWHPLISGDPESVVEAGHSVAGRSISETEVDEDDWEEHIIRWVE